MTLAATVILLAAPVLTTGCGNNEGPGDPIIYGRQVRGGYDGLTMYVNPLTTLAGQLVKSGLSLAEAERKVRTFFYIPADYPFDWIANSPASPFSPKRFQELALQSGNAEQFYSRLEGEILARQLVLPVEDTSTPVLDVVKSISGDVFGDAVSLVDAGVFGAVTQALGLNLGTSGALAAIADQLNQVLNQISVLQQQLAAAEATLAYDINAGVISPNLTNLENQVKTIGNVTQGTSSLSIGDLTTQLKTYTLANDIGPVVNYLLGQGTAPDNLVYDYAQKLGTTQLALSTADVGTFLGCPIRHNPLITQLQGQQNYLLGHLALAADIYAEQAHLQIPVKTALDAAGASLDGLAQNTLQASAQVPGYFTSPEVMLDLPANKMWTGFITSQREYDDAVSFAQSFTTGGYLNWRLANRDELENLIQNRIGKLVPTQDNSSGADTHWVSGFQAFNLSTNYYGENTYKNNSRPDNNNRQGQSYFNLSSDTGANNQNVYQWWGVNNTPATTYYYSRATGGKTNSSTLGSESAFVMVRPVGFTVVPGTEAAGGGNPFSYAQLGSSTLTVTVNATQLRSTAVLASNEVLTPALDVTARTFWTSSNQTLASVSSLAGNDLETGNVTTANGTIPANPPGTYAGPGGPGLITWHPPLTGSAASSVTFTGNFWAGTAAGVQGISKATGALIVTTPTLGAPIPTSAQVVPAKQSINLTTAPVRGVSGGTYYVTTFYKDGQLFQPDPLTVVFDLLDSAGNIIADQTRGGFITVNANNQKTSELTLFKGLPAGTYSVRARYNTPVGGANTQALVGTTSLLISNSQ